MFFYEDAAVLAAFKIRGLDTVSHNKGRADSLCARVFAMRPQLEAVQGRRPGEGGLLQRLDRDTEGLVLFAKTQAAFNALRQAAQEGRFVKGYSALCQQTEPFLAPEGLSLAQWRLILQQGRCQKLAFSCRFVFDGRGRQKVRAVPAGSSSKHASPIYSLTLSLETTARGLRAWCALQRGYRHQVRASLASLGLPILGDALYNSSQNANPFCFWASSLTFPHPQDGRKTVCGYNPFAASSSA